MPYDTQQKSEVILISIDKLFCDVECAIFFRRIPFFIAINGFNYNRQAGVEKGPHIDPNRLKIEPVLNDGIKQSSNTSNMVFNVEKLVSFVSKSMTLYPGDLIAAGTPPGVGRMEAGDVVEVAIDKPGSLGIMFPTRNNYV